jgi:uncharacterized protein YbaP (TraB family)
MDIRGLAGLFAVLLLWGVPPSAQADEAASEASAFLWKVTAPDRPGTVYLLGTLRFGDPDDRPLDRSVEQVARTARRVAFEVDPTTVDEDLAHQVARDQGGLQGQVLDAFLDRRTRALLERVAPTCGMGDLLQAPIQPWLAAALAEQACARSVGLSTQSIDGLIAAAAIGAELTPTFHGMEHLEDQLKRRAGLPEGNLHLRRTLAALERGEPQEMDAHYRAGEVRKLGRAILRQRRKSPSGRAWWEAPLNPVPTRVAFQVLVWLAEPGVSLVSVDVSHTVGKVTALEMLRNEGAVLTPVPAEGPGDPMGAPSDPGAASE